MDLTQYNQLMMDYAILSDKVDSAFESAEYTDDYSEYESLKQDLFELELMIPKMQPLK